jgi:uncharacterized protein (DUF4415 family)
MMKRIKAKGASGTETRRAAKDAENPALTAGEISAMRPFRELLPVLAAAMDHEIGKRGRPKLENPKEAVTLRLDPATVAKFKASGSDWRSRMGRVLDKAKV